MYHPTPKCAILVHLERDWDRSEYYNLLQDNDLENRESARWRRKCTRGSKIPVQARRWLEAPATVADESRLPQSFATVVLHECGRFCNTRVVIQLPSP